MSQHFDVLRKISELRTCRRQFLSTGMDCAEWNRTQSAPALARSLSEALDPDFGSPPPGNVLNALDFVIELRSGLRSSGVEGLKEVQRRLLGVSDRPRLRRTETSPLWSDHQPLRAELISKATERLFEWIRSQGFQEMHPTEQLTASQIRLCEIQPFEDYALLGAWIFPLAFLPEAGYLLPRYVNVTWLALRTSLSQGLQGSTSPLLELHLDACLRAYEVPSLS